MNFEEGETLLFDKPIAWTSFDLVKKIRGMIKTKKVGHAGTLDPLATGLMILCTGKHTKTIDLIQGQDKTYEATFYLGATTPSYDSELPPENHKDISFITPSLVEEAMQKFMGEISQMPPAFSAVQINGKRAYELARKGKQPELTPRIIRIDTFSMTAYESPQHITAHIKCSKGTYIRSLIHDLGQILGTGAYLTSLRRTAIGHYKVEDAWTLETFREFLMQSSETL